MRILTAAVLCGLLLAGRAAAEDRFTIIDKLTGATAESFVVETAKFRGSLFVSVKDKTTARVSISRPRLADGRTSDTALTLIIAGAREQPAGTYEFPPGKTEIVLSGEFAEVGVYRVELTLQQISEPPAAALPPQAVALSIERKLPTLPDNFIDIPATFRFDLPICAVCRSVEVTIDGLLRNGGGRPITVAAPQISDVGEKINAASYAVGNLTRQVTAGCIQGHELMLKAMQSCAFTAKLAGLPGAGVYDVKLSVAGVVATTAASRTVSISVRHSWVLAVLLIVIGAGLALFVRWWRSTGRTVLAQLAAASALAERIAAKPRSGLSAERLATIDRVASYVALLVADLRSNNAAADKVDDRLKGLRQQADILDRFLAAESEYDTLTAPTDRDYVEDKRAKVKAVFDAPMTAENAERSQAADAYADAVRACKIVNQIRPQVEEFGSSVTEFLEWLRQRNRTGIEAETTALRTAGTHLTELLNARNVKDLRTAFDDARIKYRDLAMKLIETRLAAAPWGVNDDEWSDHVRSMQGRLARLKARTDEPGATAELAILLGTHAAQLHRWLRNAIAKAAEAAGNAGDTAKQQSLNALLARLQDPSADPDPVAFEAWYVGYESHISRARTIASAPAGGGPQPAPTAGPAPAEQPPAVKTAVLDFDPRPWLLPPLGTTSVGYAARSQMLELLSNLAALLLVSLSGLQVLWINNYAWGTPSDLIIAIFWGAGVGYGIGAGLDEIIKQGSTSSRGAPAPQTGGR